MRCKNDLDVYHVAQRYPHVKLNSLSVNPDLNTIPAPLAKGIDQGIWKHVEKIYPSFSKPLGDSALPNGLHQTVRDRWKECEPLRKANLFAVEPLPRVMGEATIYFGEREDFTCGAVICCFLALNSDPIKSPMPFGPSRLKGLLMLANILSNTAPISGSNTPSAGGTLRVRIAQALSKMDQATMAQAILAIIVQWSRLTHSEEWHVYQEANAQLKDIEKLPGRRKEKELVQIWVKGQDDVEAAMFLDYAVLKPLRELAEFALEVMDSEFGA